MIALAWWQVLGLAVVAYTLGVVTMAVAAARSDDDPPWTPPDWRR